ncbi:unnamed protein product [Protopolystoma xenopodis]|uniref:Uncharacterized protein n=1 Tax=Protopolystoma xenopodis TaxID=117903 RepID=A0A448WD83_9PLAT|nr:unnamed protein product [Protopolystoma xenopodis]
MAKLNDDADYDAGETFENVSSRLPVAGSHDNYYGRRLRTWCVLHSRPDNKTKLRQRVASIEYGMTNFMLVLWKKGVVKYSPCSISTHVHGSNRAEQAGVAVGQPAKWAFSSTPRHRYYKKPVATGMS